MAALPPLDSLAHIDMVDVAWVRFVPVPSYMSTALSTERCSRPRATVANQDLIVALLEQTVATPVRNPVRCLTSVKGPMLAHHP